MSKITKQPDSLKPTQEEIDQIEGNQVFGPTSSDKDKLIEQLQAELDSLKAEKGMADTGFVSEGARKEIDRLQTEIGTLTKSNVELVVERNDVISITQQLKAEKECLQKRLLLVGINRNKLFDETIQLKAKIKGLKERIEFAIDYLPESPDKALRFLQPALKDNK